MEQIPLIIQKLYNLAAIIRKLKGFRFYGCSLLFIYDGDGEVQEHFVKAVKQGQPPIGTIPEAAEDYSHHRHHHHRSQAVGEQGSSQRRSRSADHHGPTSQPSGLNAKRHKGEVNIRVVDFAHTTTGRDLTPYPKGAEEGLDLGKGYVSEVDPKSGKTFARFLPKHKDEADLGFVFGIKSVVDALSGIWEHEAQRRGETTGALEGLENGDVFDKVFPQGFDISYLST